MPLNKAALEEELTSLFENPPDTFAGCAQAWADAVEAYSVAIIPASTTVTAAAEVLSSTLTGIFSANSATGNAAATSTAMEAAFKVFATTVATGMVPAYTGSPPSGNIGFASIFAVNRSSTAEAVSVLATALDTWMRTGTATLTSPPGTTINWN